MYPVFESIQVIDSCYPLLAYHIARMQRTCEALWGGPFNTDALLNELHQFQRKGQYKCKVYYSQHHYHIEYSTYQRKEIHSLQVFENDEIDYQFKFTDRSMFEKISLKSNYSELIICKNGLITDTRYSNVACWNGFEWHTPVTPLLLGCRRASLLEQGVLVTKNISIDDLASYQKISLINAMLNLGDMEIKMDNVFF